MSEATTQTAAAIAPSDGEFRIISEQFCCPNDACEGATLRREFVVDKQDARTGVRTIRGYHEACDQLWRASYKLMSGQWVIQGKVELVSDPKARAQFFALIDHLRGVTNIAREKLMQKAPTRKAS